MIYPYVTYKEKANHHEYWVAASTILNHCVGQGDTKEEALCELEENELEWIETAKECGIKIPSTSHRGYRASTSYIDELSSTENEFQNF